MDLDNLARIVNRPRFADLILGKDQRPCERCGSLTYWFRPRQRTRGFCPDHALAEPGDLGEAVKALAQAFPDAVIQAAPGPQILAPGEYAEPVKREIRGRWIVSGRPLWATAMAPPPDAGPCAGCRRTIRAYGPDAHAFCAECEESRK